MGRLYIETGWAANDGALVLRNPSTISATTSNVGTGVLVETFTQLDVTNDATGRYYIGVDDTKYTYGSVYSTTWKVGPTSGSVMTDTRRFVLDTAWRGSEMPRAVLVNHNQRRILISRNA
jgi:hypothetical protein